MHRRSVGKLRWLIPIRPGTNYATKELSRSMTQPAQQVTQKLKHLLRYVKGTCDYAYDLAP
eukprot:465778-Lingulodinium_polyedra.AAC.1